MTRSGPEVLQRGADLLDRILARSHPRGGDDRRSIRITTGLDHHLGL
jgi:hypothetical protein